MSGTLPAEMVDHIIGYLHDTPDALRNCCLVSRSWVPRTRKHLFADIKFPTEESLEAWEEMFPDPSASPACYAKTLSIECAEAVIAADVEEGGWMRGFSRVVRLEVESIAPYPESEFSLVPFHGISPTLKSLDVNIPHLPSACIFDLILSFPLLEDLAVMINQTMVDDDDNSEEDETPIATQSLTPRILTGTLELYLLAGIRPITRQLLSLPGGIHFRKLTLTWPNEENFWLTTPVVEACFHTLESLEITWDLHGESTSAPIDLSKATKLRDVVFRPGSWRVQWVVRALQTITPKHRNLRQITIHVPWSWTLARALGVRETHRGLWLDIDCCLVQLWESCSIRPKVVCTVQNMGDRVRCLLPEIMKRGIVDLVE